jgi:hypothetical protein
MNSRRSFFGQLALAVGAAIAAPSVLVPLAKDAYRWKKTHSGIWIVNPEWLAAPYEIATILSRNGLELVAMNRKLDYIELEVDSMWEERISAETRLRESFPIRMHRIGGPNIPVYLEV